MATKKKAEPPEAVRVRNCANCGDTAAWKTTSLGHRVQYLCRVCGPMVYSDPGQLERIDGE